MWVSKQPTRFYLVVSAVDAARSSLLCCVYVFFLATVHVCLAHLHFILKRFHSVLLPVSIPSYIMTIIFFSKQRCFIVYMSKSLMRNKKNFVHFLFLVLSIQSVNMKGKKIFKKNSFPIVDFFYFMQNICTNVHYFDAIIFLLLKNTFYPAQHERSNSVLSDTCTQLHYCNTLAMHICV